MPATYVRNGVWGWSVEAQEAVLAAAGVLDRERAWRDILPDRRAKRPGQVHGEWLKERAIMLRPTGRSSAGTIYVATMLVLGVREADLAKTLAAASARGSTIVALDSKVEIAPDAGAYGVSAALEDWARAKRSAQTQPGRLLGVQAAAAVKRDRTMRGVRKVRELWRDAKPGRPTTAELEELSGLSAKTLYNELGRRPAIRKKASQSLARAVKEIHDAEI